MQSDRSTSGSAFVTTPRSAQAGAEDVEIGGAVGIEPLVLVEESAPPGAGSWIPTIGSTGSVGLGSSNFVLTLRHALGGGTAFLVVGDSIERWNGVPLPLGFGGSCRLLVSGAIIQPMPVTGSGPGIGSIDVKIPLPSGPTWSNRVFFAQWAIADNSAPKGLTFSDAARMILL